MHIDMTHAIEMGKYRHACLILHAPDQALAAARHNHVNIAVQPGQHHADRSTVRRVDNLHAIRIKTGSFQRTGKTAMNKTCRILNFRRAAQNHRIAGFQTQCRRIGRHIGAAFINHPDNPQRHAQAGNIKPAIDLPLRHALPDRIVQRDNRFQCLGNALKTRLIKHDAVEPRRPDILRFGQFHILAIGGENIGGIGAQFIGCGLQSGVFLIG